MKLKCVLSLMIGFFVGSLGLEPVSGQEPGHASVAHGIVFLPLDFYLDNGKGLGLSEEQQREIQRIIEDVREPGEKLAAEVKDRTLALHEAVAQNPVEIDKAMERFKAVIQAEDEMQMLQFQVRMKMRAVLTPEQFEKVKTTVANAAQKGESSGNVVKKRQKIQQQSKGGEELEKQMQRIAEMAEHTDNPEVREKLQGALSKLREAAASGNKEVVNDILAAVKKLIQEHPPKP